VSRTSTASSSRRETSPGPVPHSAADVRATLERLGIHPSRRLGQSFLTDPFVADAEAALADAQPTDPVLEIGGGLGLLTEALLRRGFRSITVVERDRRLARHLRAAFSGRITVLEADALSAPWPKVEVVVGNLPFSVGTPILQRLFSEGVRRAVLLLQHEVVDRLSAAPGSRAYGRLTLQGALYGTIEAHQVVPSSSFEPVPAVEGRLVVFERRRGDLPVTDVPGFERITRILFGRRRKQLRNLLPLVTPSGTDPATIARNAGWPDGWDRLRPESLPPDAYFRLAVALASPAAEPLPGARYL